MKKAKLEINKYYKINLMISALLCIFSILAYLLLPGVDKADAEKICVSGIVLAIIAHSIKMVCDNVDEERRLIGNAILMETMAKFLGTYTFFLMIFLGLNNAFSDKTWEIILDITICLSVIIIIQMIVNIKKAGIEIFHFTKRKK